MLLPEITKTSSKLSYDNKRLFIVAEGFEKRSLNWVSATDDELIFNSSIICRYVPSKKSRFEEMYCEVKKRTKEEPIILKYNRFEPTIFEHELKQLVVGFSRFDEIIIDITVMSKLLIMIVICLLKNYDGKVKVIYSESISCGPSEKTYKDTMGKKSYGTCIGLSSVGVGDVVRTPNLSSIVMQNCPLVLVAFLSFNEQLINVLLNEISPAELQLINHSCKRDAWRSQAMIDIHKDIIDEYLGGNLEDIFCCEVTDYKLVFLKLATIYKEKCYSNRIVLAPTGCKLHAVSCSILKLCCPDIHVEYPTPESYLFDGYSSDEVYEVYEINFPSFKKNIFEIAKEYELNG